jgi:ubiquinone/menaquinone biosynthesis C-methylase UbiE
MAFLAYARSIWSRLIVPLRNHSHPRRRRRLIPIFLKYFRITPAETFLDIGGPTYGFELLLNISANSFCVNVDFTNLNFPEDQTDEAMSKFYGKLVLANGYCLPFRDKAFDYVISNDTLEHVPRQYWIGLAAEIQRVARRGYFVVAPNFWYFLEPHYFLPFFHWLPRSLTRWLTTEEIRLPKGSELREIFPGATILGLGPKLMPDTLVAFRVFEGAN